tara:strand:- start:39 stop:209 length:171 start_codon:yes stop_codon:yes gene_type:complete
MILAKMTNGCQKGYEQDSIVKTPTGDKDVSYLAPGVEVLAFDGGIMVVDSMEEVQQ